MSGFHHLIVHPNVPLLDEPLDGSARNGGKAGTQKDIKPLAGTRLLKGERFAAVVHGWCRGRHALVA
jgi:hypothetical protein